MGIVRRAMKVALAATAFFVSTASVSLSAAEKPYRCSDPQIRTFCLAARSGSVNVTFWGDSITRGVSQIDYPNSWAGLTERYFRIAFGEGPAKADFIATNMSIDGFGVGQMVSDKPVPAYGKPWREAVRDTKPDMLFIAIGMNSNGDPFWFGNFLQNTIDYVRTWQKVPTIVLVTPIVPAKKKRSKAAPPRYVDRDAMEIRALAELNGLLLVDANALHHYYLVGGAKAKMYLSNKGTGNGVNHPSWQGHHDLIYKPVEKLLDSVFSRFN